MPNWSFLNNNKEMTPDCYQGPLPWYIFAWFSKVLDGRADKKSIYYIELCSKGSIELSGNAFCYARRQYWPVEGKSVPINENYIDSLKKILGSLIHMAFLIVILFKNKKYLKNILHLKSLHDYYIDIILLYIFLFVY